MTVTASLAGSRIDPQATAVKTGFAMHPTTGARTLPAVRVPLQAFAQVEKTGRPESVRRTALLQTPRGREMQARVMTELGQALNAHGLAPLVALRMSKGLSQKALCDAAGLPQPHVSRLENGKVPNPDGTTLQKLAQALDTSMDEVMAAVQAGVQA